jgi:hypothetical protein
MQKRRLTTYPPGLPMLHRALSIGADGNATLAECMTRLAGREMDEEVSPRIKRNVAFAALFQMLCTSIVPVLVFLICRQLTRSDDTSIRIAALSAMIPSLHLFSSMEGPVLAPIMLAPILAVAIGVRRKSKAWLITAGAIAGIAIFFSYAALPVLLLIVLFIIAGTWDGSFRTPVTSVSCWALGGACILFLGFCCFRYDAIAMMSTALGNNREFYAQGNRRYGISLLSNLAELNLLFGTPLVCAIIIGTCMTVRSFVKKTVRNRLFRFTPPTLSNSFVIATTIAFSLLILSGSVRGEAGRNLLPLMPIALACLSANRTWVHAAFPTVALLATIHLVTCSLRLETVFGFWTA